MGFLFPNFSTIIPGTVTWDDDQLLRLGTDGDQVFVNRSSTLSADTALSSVLIGTPVTPALAANSLIVSNVTASGDILIAGNRGGNSEAYLFADTSVGVLYLSPVQGGLMVALAADAPAPDNGNMHIWSATAGSVTADGNTQLTIESSGNAGINILSGNSNYGVLQFGDDGSVAAGYIKYAHNTKEMGLAVEDGGFVSLSDDRTFALGNDHDQAFYNRSTALNANTALTNVLIGTPVTPALAANSLIVANITASGDMLFVTNNGGNSLGWLHMDGSENDITFYNPSGTALNLNYDAGISLSPVGINVSGGADALVTLGPGGRNGDWDFLQVDGLATLTANSTTVTSARLDLSVAHGSYTITTAAGLYVNTVTRSSGSGTVTNSAGIYVEDAGTFGTNNYAIFVDSGSIRLDGSLWVESSSTEGTAGEQLTSGGAGTVMTWAAAGSLREFKKMRGVLDPTIALERVLSAPVEIWTYDPDARVSTHDFDTEYTGVVADKAPWAMHHEGKIFSPVSAFGHTAGAVQALYSEIESLKKKIVELGK